jgi:surface protein
MDANEDGDEGIACSSSFTPQPSPNQAQTGNFEEGVFCEVNDAGIEASHAAMVADDVNTNNLVHGPTLENCDLDGSLEDTGAIVGSNGDADCEADDYGEVVIEEVNPPSQEEVATLSMTECHDSSLMSSTLVPPSGTNADIPSPPESALRTVDNSPSSTAGVTHRRSSDTKRRFRAARAVVPGAMGSSTNNSPGAPPSDIDDATFGELSTVRRSFAASSEGQSEDLESFNISEELSMISYRYRRESGTLPDTVGEAGEHDEFEAYTIGDVDAMSLSPPRIVTAEIVVDGANMDQSERRRIVQETIQSISNQAVTAEVVQQVGDKSARKYLVVILMLICIVIVFVVVLMVVLTTLASGSSKGIVDAPTVNTPSPTPFVDDSVFRTMDELYQAVDAYLILTSNSSTQSLVETSDVALRYGYPMSSWNVSLIKNFSWVFDPTRAFTRDSLWEFNEDLGDWDVSNAEAMVGMFTNAYEFEGVGLENWNVSKVRDFSYMFMDSGFNRSISRWDTSNAELMVSMFAGVFAFNDDLSMWNVSRVQTMSSMFSGAASFEGIGLEQWDVGNVRDFSGLFLMCSMFNGIISDWDTSNAELMDSMFSDALIFNGNLSSWDVSNVTDMSNMFFSASSFAGDGISNWDVSKVTAMDGMFGATYAFNGDVSQWDISRVVDLSSMVRVLNSLCGFSLC